MGYALTFFVVCAGVTSLLLSLIYYIYIITMRVNSKSLVSQYESENRTNLRLTVDSYFMPFSGHENKVSSKRT